MKRTSTLVLAVLCAIGLLLSPTTVSASMEHNEGETCIMVDGEPKQVHLVQEFADGSKLYGERPVILERTRGGITGQKSYHHRNSNGDVLWTATVIGTFMFNGTTSSCSSASCSTIIYGSTWSEQSCSAYPSGNTAVGNVTMIRKLLFIVVESVPITITLTCDRNGNLS